MLTNKAKYGLKAMLHLADAPSGGPTLVADIAAAETIPKKFLDAILGELRMAGLVHSKKGRGGGFVLAKTPSQIKVDCPTESKCRVRLMMVDVRSAIADVLDHRTLEDMRTPGVLEKPVRRTRAKAPGAAEAAPARARKTGAAKPVRAAAALAPKRG
jgi:DNA-binding IscR family transcriptional regulator